MTIKVKYDPLNKFSEHSEYEIHNSLGFIPGWALNEEYLFKPLKEALDDQYGFGLFEMKGGEITKDGIYKYPRDPELYPLIKIIRHDEILYQYLYGIVAIVQKDGSSFVTRMD